MNIGFFTDGFTPQLNGVATNLEALADALEARGHAVSIFAPKMGAYVDQRSRVVRVPSFLALKDPPLWVALPFEMELREQISKLAALVTDGKNGLVVPADVNEFTVGVRGILANPYLAQRMRCAALEGVREFSIEKQAEELLGLYEELILEGQPRAVQAPTLPYYGQATVRTR